MSEELLEILSNYAIAQEVIAFDLKRSLVELATKGTAEKPKNVVTVPEQTFNLLKFEPQEGAKIGAYDVAYKTSNLGDNWSQAFNILRQSNATITLGIMVKATFIHIGSTEKAKSTVKN